MWNKITIRETQNSHSQHQRSRLKSDGKIQQPKSTVRCVTTDGDDERYASRRWSHLQTLTLKSVFE